jgi:type II secretory pathway pseudopilin PulG
MELVVALAIFVGVGMAVLTVLRQAVAGLDRARDTLEARDLAHSAAALMAAGIDEGSTLQGEAPTWETVEPENPAAFDDAPPEPSPWRLSITTNRAGIAGLTRVELTARHSESNAVFILRRLVDPGVAGGFEPTRDDDLMDKIRDAQRAGGRP